MATRKIDESPTFRALAVALRRLAPEQGRIARRNARRAVKAALREVAAWLDTEYPAPPRRVKETKRGRLSAVAKINRLHRAGWVECQSVSAVTALRDAGCATRTVHLGVLANVYVRAWAITIYRARPLADLVRARRSRQFREALLVELALTTK